jgi:ABC-type phosphate/phosphonate transport system permease subunit
VKRLKKRITAILLIVAFIQKLGLGLFIHAWLHEKPISFTYNSKNPVAHLQKVPCSCVEDAMMAFTGSTASFAITTPIKYFFSYNHLLRIFYSSARKIYYSLRGPPSLSDTI